MDAEADANSDQCKRSLSARHNRSYYWCNRKCHYPGGYYWNYNPGFLILKSSHCHSFENRTPVDEIYGWSISKWVAKLDSKLGCQDSDRAVLYAFYLCHCDSLEGRNIKLLIPIPEWVVVARTRRLSTSIVVSISATRVRMKPATNEPSNFGVSGHWHLHCLFTTCWG